jgi:hypothetical protein
MVHARLGAALRVVGHADGALSWVQGSVSERWTRAEGAKGRLLLLLLLLRLWILLRLLLLLHLLRILLLLRLILLLLLILRLLLPR